MIPYYTGPIPALTTAQMVEVDRAMIEDYGIDLAQMMENAGRNLAHLARERFLNGDPRRAIAACFVLTGIHSVFPNSAIRWRNAYEQLGFVNRLQL